MKIKINFSVIDHKIEEINTIYLDRSVVDILTENQILTSYDNKVHELKNCDFTLDQHKKKWLIINKNKHPLQIKEGFYNIYDQEENSIICYSLDQYDNLERIINAVYSNLVYSRYYINVADKLSGTPESKFSNAPHFFAMTREGFRKIGILLLATAYDSNNNSVSLKKILNIIESNHPKWKQLLHHLLDLNIDQLNQDKYNINQVKNPVVKELFKKRNTAIAHFDQNELDNKNLAEFEKNQLNELISQGIEICHWYSQIIKHDLPEYNISEDYHNLLG